MSHRPFASSFVIAALCLSACGGGTGSARTAPSIANLDISPRVVYRDTTPRAFNVGFDLFDPNRDVTSTSFALRDAGGSLVDQQTIAITANSVSVRIEGGACVPVPQVGTFTVEISTTDASGLGSNTLVTTVDVVPNPWSDVPADPLLRTEAAAVALGGRIYVIGGARYDLGMIPGPSTPIVGVFDPSTNTWSNAAELVVPRRALAAAVADGRIYAIGGDSTQPTSPLGTLVATVEQYDPALDIWTPRAAMPTARSRIAAATLNGRIYVVGGGDSNPLATVESYDPITNTWRSEPSLLYPRYGARAAAFNGRLVVAGGRRNANHCEDRVEVFDPATGVWTTTPDNNLCATWLVTSAGQLFAGVGTGLRSTAGVNPIVWHGRTDGLRGSDIYSAAAGTDQAIFVFNMDVAERYVLAHEIYNF